MPQEVPVNNVETQLNGAINNVVNTLNVDSASHLPSTTDNYRIKIDDEIMTVWSRSGTTLSVYRAQEGTTAASHADNAPVNVIQTAESMKRIARVVGTQNSVQASGFNNIFIAGNLNSNVSSEYGYIIGVGNTIYGGSNFTALVGRNCESGTDLSIGMGIAAITRLPGAFTYSSGGYDFLGSNPWGIGAVQRHRLLLTSNVLGGSNNYLTGPTGNSAIQLPTETTAIYKGRVLAVDTAGAVCGWGFDFTYQRQSGSSGEFVTNIFELPGYGAYSPGYEMPPSMSFGNEFSASLRISHVNSGNDLQIRLTNSGSNPCRVVCDLEITELLQEIEFSGYYYY